MTIAPLYVHEETRKAFFPLPGGRNYVEDSRRKPRVDIVRSDAKVIVAVGSLKTYEPCYIGEDARICFF